MPVESDYHNLFSPAIESVEKFITQFKMQIAEKLDAASDNSSKHARILTNALPTVILTDIHNIIVNDNVNTSQSLPVNSKSAALCCSTIIKKPIERYVAGNK